MTGMIARASALLTALLMTPLAAPARADAEPRPNIVFVLADDLGFSDTTLYGTTRFYQTPNIERLAGRGMLFRNAYAASPLCSPTRSSILTGLWPARTGIIMPVCHLEKESLEVTFPESGPASQNALLPQSLTRLKREYFTLAEALHQAGYATGHFGKWHLGPEPYSALQQGFDVDVPHTPAPGPYKNYLAPWEFWKGQGQPGEHIEDRMSQEAIAFMRTNKDRPFYLNYWAFSVHAPFKGKEELIEKYRQRVDPDDPQRCPVYGAMVHSLDEAVGRLLDALDELRLAERTIIIFFSDNGGNMYDRVEGIPPTSNAPLRGGKANQYEGGTREPCAVVWPGRVKPGSSSDALLSSVDFYPTILDMLGLKPQPNQRFDGVSQVPALLGKEAPRTTTFGFFPFYLARIETSPSSWVRSGDWKLIRFHCDNPDQTDRFELYNLKEDEGEKNDLAGKMPDKVRELAALVEQFLADTRAPVPRPNPAYCQPVLGWQAAHQAKIKHHDGRLVVECLGNDPQISTDKVPALDHPATLQLRMKNQAGKTGQLFWITKNDPKAHRSRSTFFRITADGQWHEYTVRVAPDSPTTSLRLDPCDATGTVEIAWMRLVEADGSVIQRWQFDGDK